MIGRFDLAPLPPNARTRRIYDEPKWTGYEVVLDVFPDVFAYGILLVPKDLKPGEQAAGGRLPARAGGPAAGHRRPGDHPAYHDFAAELAERGFITFAPQNLYIFERPLPHACSARPTRSRRRSSRSSCRSTSRSSTGWRRCRSSTPKRIAFYGLSLRRQDRRCACRRW